MEIKITDAAKDKIQKNIKGDAKLLLSLDDGVGPYSDEGSCALGIAFYIIAVDPDTDTPDYEGKIDSDMGPLYYKGYSKEYMDNGLKLDLRFNQLVLSGNGGEIDDNVPIQDMRG